VAGLVFLLDPQPWFAVPWAVGGGIVGLFGLKVLRPFADPLLDWYRNRNPNHVALQRRILTLSVEEKTNTEEFERSIEEEMFWMSLPLAPLLGLFHGVLFGTILGALSGSGADGALIGMLLGPVFIACIAALTLAVMVNVGTGLSWSARLRRRASVVVSPLLIVPAVWHCLRTVLEGLLARRKPCT
jgi:hypothetical protein